MFRVVPGAEQVSLLRGDDCFACTACTATVVDVLDTTNILNNYVTYSAYNGVLLELD